MAEGILRRLAGDCVEVHSAGTEVTRVHPLAIAAMANKGIDISQHGSKHMDELRGQTFDFVVTVCDNARESCPIFPGDPERIHWSIADPSAVEGDDATKLHAFSVAADELMGRIRYLIAGRPACRHRHWWNRGTGRSLGRPSHRRLHESRPLLRTRPRAP